MNKIQGTSATMIICDECVPAYDYPVNLAPYPSVPCTAPAKPASCKKKPKNISASELNCLLDRVYEDTSPIKKENNMGYDVNVSATVNAEANQRRHLVSRLGNVEFAKREALRTKFNMNPVAAPRNLADLTAALTAGNYEIDKTHFNADGEFLGWHGVMDTVKFTDPTKVKDEDGYKSAKALLGKAYTDASDAIIVKSPVDGLAALQAFEAQSF